MVWQSVIYSGDCTRCGDNPPYDAEKDFVRLRHLADEYNVEEFVIGMPLNMNGTKGMRAEQTEKFAEALAAAFPDIPYHFWDERLTTVMAQRQLIEADVSRKNEKK